MKVVKIIHRAMRPNNEGRWLVWCMVYVNGKSRYSALKFDTFAEARELKEGDYLKKESA